MGVHCPVVEDEDIQEFKSKVFFIKKETKGTREEYETIGAILGSSRKFVNRDMIFAKTENYELIKEFVAIKPGKFPDENGEDGFFIHVHIFYKVL